MKDVIWNPWHGCVKFSEGCLNCYVYRRDESVGNNAREVHKTSFYDLIVKKDRCGQYKVPSGANVYVCMTSDFLLDEADSWRSGIYDMMRIRNDLTYTIITKRIERLKDCLPWDWKDGWDNVTFCSTMENEKRFKERLEPFMSVPIKHRAIICEPLLGPIDMKEDLPDEIEWVICGGESGPSARMCDYEWVLGIREACRIHNVNFRFKQTGSRFRKDGKIYLIDRKYQHAQAKKAGIDFFRENLGK